MYRIKQTALLIIVLLTSWSTRAQYQSPPVWIFGHHAGLDFNSGAPVPINTDIYTHFTRSSIQCDAAGNVMFYTNGFHIWNKLGVEMTNGNNPAWPTSYDYMCAMQTQIVPDLADTNRFFVFTIFQSPGTPPWGDEGNGQLTVTIVDMTMNGGLGDVPTGLNHTLIDNNTGNYLQVVPDDKCGLWLVVHSGFVHSFRFKSYHITAAGVSMTPVVSAFSFIPSAVPAFPFGVDNRYGHMIYNYKLQKLFLSYNGGDLYAYDFLPSTGNVVSPQMLGWNYDPSATSSASLPGICLSPNEDFLYTVGFTYGSTLEIRQYPILVAGGTASLGAPYIVFAPGISYYAVPQQPLSSYFNESDIQLGPDNRIYVAYTIGQGFMGRVNDPDQAGAACNFDPDAIALQPGTYTTSALPSPSIKRPVQQLIPGTSQNISLCFEPSVILTAPDPSYANYTWQNGQTGINFTATETGLYTVVSSNDACKYRRDTFNVELTNFDLDLGNDTTICTGSKLVLNAEVPGGSYLWQDGSIAPSYTVITEGEYSVTVQIGKCKKEDKINVAEEICNCRLSLPSAFSPNEDGRNDVFRPIITQGCPNNNYQLSIYNRWGQLVFYSIHPQEGWNGRFQGEPAEVGTYMYYLEYGGGKMGQQVLKGDLVLVR